MSNETKFSKGKWQALHVGAAVIVACDDAVAELHGKNMDANATLFAEAANMYHLLQTILDRAVFEEDREYWDNEIERLLAKARGEVQDA